VIIPYVDSMSEAVASVYNRYGFSSAMKPHTTIRNLLVHPKDKVNTEETAECVYRIPCKNCQKVYIGETERSLGVCTKEHRKKVEQQEERKYTRSTKRQSQSEQDKSAVTDCTSTKRITSSTGMRQLSLPVSLTELHSGSGRLSRFVRRAKVLWTEMRAPTSWVISMTNCCSPCGCLVWSSHSEEGSSCFRNVNNMWVINSGCNVD